MTVTKTEVRLKDMSHMVVEDGKEKMVIMPYDWEEVVVYANTDDCEHGETMCGECVESWGIDYHVRITLGDGRVLGMNSVPGYAQASDEDLA